MTTNDAELKERVRRHWEAEPCGTRGILGESRKAFFDRVAAERYVQEPYIPSFARFREAAGACVLEIGVGAGSDFEQWHRAGAVPYGIDLTEAGLALTFERVALLGQKPRLSRADCEHLPFADNTFDIVYAYGVIHHSPDTPKAVSEIHRVLKPGGAARVLVYHHPSITGGMLWAIHCLAKGRPWRSSRWAIGNYLESPGTKAYSRKEAAILFSNFSRTQIWTELGTGDLLLMRPSVRYQNPFATILFALYPRWLVRRLGRRFGLGLFIDSVK